MPYVFQGQNTRGKIRWAKACLLLRTKQCVFWGVHNIVITVGEYAHLLCLEGLDVELGFKYGVVVVPDGLRLADLERKQGGLVCAPMEERKGTP
jgi:hypothetical protein